MNQKTAVNFLTGFVCLALLSPLWVFKDLLFPFITSKAFSFRIFIELGLPFYVYLLATKPELRPAWKNPVLISMFVFLTLYFISALFGVNVTRSLWGNFERMGGIYYILHLTLLAFYMALLGKASGRHFKFILLWALAVAAVVTLNGVSGWLGGPVFVADPSLPTRISSTFGNPIFVGSFLVLPLFLSCFFALDAESVAGKILFWLLSALLFWGIVLSQTRGALVGIAIGLIFSSWVYVFLHPNKKLRLYGIPTVILGTAVIVSMFVFHNHLPQNRLTRIFNLEDSNTFSRLIQWKVALKGFSDQPVLGVGAENYYFIANKYYNPEIVKYDFSWFDKPHNYILEVLVTGGILSFLPYLGLLLAVPWVLYKGFKTGFFSLLQTCLLATGFIGYVVQNLFVFDTIPASLMFFLFCGFTAYVWHEIGALNKVQNQKISNKSEAPSWSMPVSVGAGLLAIYCVYVTNILPLKAAHDVNYGYAYIGANQEKAFNYFTSATENLFNFDLQDTASRFSELANGILSNGPQTDQNRARQMVNAITQFQKEQAERIDNDPVSWQRLSNDYYLQAVINNQPLGPYAEYSIKKAVELAPGRYEPELFLAQIYMVENQPQKALDELNKMSKVLPLTGYTSGSRWLESVILHSLGRDHEALTLAQSLLDNKFYPSAFKDMSWIVGYYTAQQNLNQAVEISETAVKIFPNDPDAFFLLAQLYSRTGKIDLAKDMAQRLIDSDVPNKKAVAEFLSNLNKTK